MLTAILGGGEVAGATEGVVIFLIGAGIITTYAWALPRLADRWRRQDEEGEKNEDCSG